jgi:hypothetical protein
VTDLERSNDAATAGLRGSGDAIIIHARSTMVAGEKAHITSALSVDRNPGLITLGGPDDPLRPQNLSQWKKWLYAHITGWLSLAGTFAMSVYYDRVWGC